jgi:sulfate transport system permease protein
MHAAADRSRRNWGRRLLIALALVIATLTLVVPLVLIFVAAFADGIGGYLRNITAPDMRHAIFLTVLTAVIVVPVNMVFGIATAWVVA